MVDVPGRKAAVDEVFRGNLVRGRLGLLRGPGEADAVPRGGAERHELRERRGIEEDLQLRLEEFPHPVGTLPGADLVAVRPADDREPHWQLAPEGFELPLEVQVHALRGLRPEIRAVLRGRPDPEREHHVELPRRAEFPLAVRATDLQFADAGVDLRGREAFLLGVGRGLEEMVAPIRLTAPRARHEDVGEVVHMAGCLERGLRQDRRRVDQVIVVAQAEERLRPEVLPAPAQEDAIVAVVVEAPEAPVQFGRGPEETATDRQRHHVVVRGHRRRKGRRRDKAWGNSWRRFEFTVGLAIRDGLGID